MMFSSVQIARIGTPLCPSACDVLVSAEMARDPHRSILVTVGLFTAVWSGCNTPTLPIPPPITEALSAPGADGTVEVVVEGTRVPASGAIYLMVFNNATQVGVLEARRVSGEFRVRIGAEPGDTLKAYWMDAGFTVGMSTESLIVPAP